MSDEEKSITNLDLMGKFFSNYGADSAIGWLNPERVMRNDIEVSVEKLMDGRSANIWIDAQAPYSSTRRELSLKFTFRRADSPDTHLVPEDLNEFEFVFKDFYRDIIVDRIFKNLFENVAVTPAYRGV
jgi:hypothetical protein